MAPEPRREGGPRPMDGHSVSVLSYRSFKPQGKVRRRVQDLRISSASRADFPAGGHRLDLSHNESARMAVDSLLSRGLKEYHRVLRAEGEVDFLSQPEKMYIMENGRAGSAGSSRTLLKGCLERTGNSLEIQPFLFLVFNAAGSSTSGDQVESSLPGSQGDTLCPAPSTDSDPPASEDQSCQRDVSSCVPVKPSLEVFFQSHGGAASMKDLIREFMRKATETLAIVMDSFSDVELLCDLLEASRKRNVSVYLLLDHLNLSLFLHMWQELQLNSKNFPKLCVRSVQGQTYCARTGRKLTGQIRESFIITDWTKVLTGSFSFSWLSWQVHRSLAVLLKGSTVPPFNTEFLRLNSSSQTVPGFVNYTPEPHTLPFFNRTPQAPQNQDKCARDAEPAPSKLRVEEKQAEAKAKVQFFSSLQWNRGREVSRPAGGAVGPEPPQNGRACQSETAGGAVRTCQGPQRNGGPLDDGGNRVQGPRSPLSPAHISHVGSQLSGLSIGPACPTRSPCRTVRYRTANPNPDYARRFFFQQNDKDPSAKTLGAAARQKNQQQWFHAPSFRATIDFLSPRPRSPSSSSPQLTHLKKDPLLPASWSRGLRCGLQGRKSRLLTRQPPAASGPAPHLKAQLQEGPELLPPGAKPNQEAPPRLDWKPQSRAANPKLGARHSFLSSLYRPVWRPLHSGGGVSLRRSQSFT